MIFFLKSRLVLRLDGNKDDLLKLLQNISTNDISKISDSTILYNLFLLSNGRFALDNFLFLMNDAIHIDCCIEHVDRIISHIKRYRVRTQIDIILTDLKVFSIVEDHGLYKDFLNNYLDVRLDIMGSRLYFDVEIENYDDEIGYHFHRVRNLIPEGSYDMKDGESFPIYFKMHELNAISINKGCYIGQETVNRLFRTAEIRKILLTFKMVDSCIDSIKYGEKVFYDGVECGVICSLYNKDCGFMLINKEFENKEEFIVLDIFQIRALCK